MDNTDGATDASTTHHLDCYYRGSLGRQHVLGRCPFKEHLVRLNVVTGEVRQLRCWRNRCPSCAWRRAVGIGYAITMARPTLMVTLNLLPEKFPDIKRCMQRLRERLTYRGWEFEWAYGVEQPNPTTPPHVHILVHGQRVPPDDVWVEQATQSGFDVDHRPRTSRGSDTYLFKKVSKVKYGGWSDGLDAIDAHLELNGGRIIHATRSFWRDHSGEPIAGMDEAVRIARQAVANDDSSDWILIGETNIARYRAHLRAMSGRRRSAEVGRCPKRPCLGAHDSHERDSERRRSNPAQRKPTRRTEAELGPPPPHPCRGRGPPVDQQERRLRVDGSRKAPFGEDRAEQASSIGVSGRVRRGPPRRVRADGSTPSHLRANMVTWGGQRR